MPAVKGDQFIFKKLGWDAILFLVDVEEMYIFALADLTQMYPRERDLNVTRHGLISIRIEHRHFDLHQSL